MELHDEERTWDFARRIAATEPRSAEWRKLHAEITAAGLGDAVCDLLDKWAAAQKARGQALVREWYERKRREAGITA